MDNKILYVPEACQFSDIPKFENKESSFEKTFEECKYGFTFLILWNVLIFALVFISFVEYDTR